MNLSAKLSAMGTATNDFYGKVSIGRKGSQLLACVMRFSLMRLMEWRQPMGLYVFQTVLFAS
jgi:hypothetical protein